MQTLDAELSRAAQIDARDAALATQLVYGVLRTAGSLEKRIGAHAKDDRWRGDPVVRAHMLIAVYSVSFLDRIPDHAAVSQAVEAIKRAAGKPVAGFANAVLRNLLRARDGQASDDDDDALSKAVVEALPGWLRRRLRKAVGADIADFVCGELPPPIGLCLRAGEDRDDWIARLREAAPSASIEPGDLSQRCVLVRGTGKLQRLPGTDDAWVVQEQGAQAIALSVGAQPGEALLDACAGRGGKTWLLADAVGETGVRATYAVDWSVGVGEATGPYDRVLVDAPCSGVGTLRRRPEIAARLAGRDIARLAELQLAITRRVATLLRDGGRLIYAVCSVLPDECEGVVEALCNASDGPKLEPAPFDSELGRKLARGGSSFRLMPAEHGTDGYFVASFVVRKA
jgi:16S rRNA (cytosine967-C5)-methyltransferase